MYNRTVQKCLEGIQNQAFTKDCKSTTMHGL